MSKEEFLCSHCGRLLPKNAIWCCYCQKRVEKICPQCKKNLPVNAKICCYCGSVLNEGRNKDLTNDTIKSYSSPVFAASPTIPVATPSSQKLMDNLHFSLTRNVKLDFICVEPGTISFEKDKGQSNVLSIADRFWIGRTVVTRCQWKTILDSQKDISSKYDNYPIENITFHEVQDFVNALNRKFKDVLPIGYQFALPKVDQWKYAAFGGQKNKVQTKYAGSDKLKEVAWYSRNTSDLGGLFSYILYGVVIAFAKAFHLGILLGVLIAMLISFSLTKVFGLKSSNTRPVAQKKPNILGLFDMCGNVWEMCNPFLEMNRCPSDKNSLPVCGGSYLSGLRDCLISNTLFRDTNKKYDDVGFRLVIVPSKK